MTAEAYWSIFLGGLAVFAAFLTIALVWNQINLMNRQLEITEKQDELLARTAKLSMEIELDKTGPPRLVFSVRNDGKGSARGFYWHVYVPTRLLAQRSFDVGGAIILGQEVGGDMIAFRSFYEQPIFPSRSVSIGSVTLAHPLPNGPAGSFLWQITAEVGVFPDDGSFQVHDAIFPSAELADKGARWRFDPTSTAKVTRVERPGE